MKKEQRNEATHTEAALAADAVVADRHASDASLQHGTSRRQQVGAKAEAVEANLNGAATNLHLAAYIKKDKQQLENDHRMRLKVLSSKLSALQKKERQETMRAAMTRSKVEPSAAGASFAGALMTSGSHTQMAAGGLDRR